jgi:hypothetical protein
MRRRRSASQIVEFATPGSPEEGGDGVAGADEYRACREPRVSQRDVSTSEFCQLNTVAAGVARRALTPDDGPMDVL